MKFRFLLLSLAICPAAVGQQPASDFVLDPDKPYVYLQFDHVGPRISNREGEGNVGLWLRIVNNCRIPISVPALSPIPGIPGDILFDEVATDPVTMRVWSEDLSAASADAPVGTPAGGPSTEVSAKSAPAGVKNNPPRGYSGELYNMFRVLPGKDILFSVPISHVQNGYYMRVWFVLDAGRSTPETGPHSYLNFFEYQIPPKAMEELEEKPRSPGTSEPVQPKSPESGDVTAKPSGDTLLHEANHTDPVGGPGLSDPSQPR
jgi:hypothetical protein